MKTRRTEQPLLVRDTPELSQAADTLTVRIPTVVAHIR